jgi:histidinol-phosphate aminotransferase
MRLFSRVEAIEAFPLADFGGHDKPTLAQNESAFAPSPAALEAGRAALARAALYPDPDWNELRSAIAETLGVERGLVLCGAGSMDLISCVVRAYSGPGDEILASAYTYLFVASTAAQAGATYVQVPEDDFAVSVDRLIDAVTPATRIIFLCNPGNPTGTRIGNAEIVRLRASLPAGVLLVIDQAYGEFDDQDPRPVFQLVNEGNTVVLRTLSKAYGLAGLRVGWGLFPADVGREVRKLVNSNNVTGVALAMATAALQDRAYVSDVVRRTAAIRDRLAGRLRDAGLEVPSSFTNFVLVRFSGEAEAVLADERLRAGGLIARKVAGYGLRDCLRITIGREEEMVRVGQILGGLRGESGAI